LNYKFSVGEELKSQLSIDEQNSEALASVRCAGNHENCESPGGNGEEPNQIEDRIEEAFIEFAAGMKCFFLHILNIAILVACKIYFLIV